jgi:uncharacterized protein (DUF1501 family)
MSERKREGHGPLGRWGRREARHLLSRAGFGGTPEEIDHLAAAETRAFARLHAPVPAANDNLGFLTRVASRARLVCRQLEGALASYTSAVRYPEFRFSQSLKLVAQMICAEMPVRLYYVELGGFDTHASQPNRHAALLQELSEGLGAFLHDLHKQGHLDRTLVMTFSEFGRRVRESHGAGTDHGAASVMLLAGGRVRPGLHGAPADLGNLDSGDRKHRGDFRSVFGTVWHSWLGSDAAAILRGRFEPLSLLRA